MSLKPCYDMFWRDGLIYTVLYWLAVPTLILVNFLGVGKEPFDVYNCQPDRAYYVGGLPADPPPYDEYLLTLYALYEIKCHSVEVRDALYA